MAAARALAARLGRRLAGTVTGVDTPQPLVALTFDDGPDPEWTPRVLEVLERYGARGTFFMVGAAARRRPDLVARVAGGGHAVANHSWDHTPFSGLRAAARRRQLLAAQRALAPHGRRLFRPPFGSQTLGSRLDAALLGYAVVGWTVDSGDWWDPDPDHLAQTLDRRVGPGDIVLLHDAVLTAPAPAPLPRTPHRDRAALVQGLDRYLAATAGRLRFVTVPALLAGGRPRRVLWWRRLPA
jgi:peptidoglycan/xylan/chitin deacetylase (PgdA/CDA1 family)